MAPLSACMATQRAWFAAALHAWRALIWGHMAHACAPVIATTEQRAARRAAAHIHSAACNSLEHVPATCTLLVGQMNTWWAWSAVGMACMWHLFVTARWRWERAGIRALHLSAAWHRRLEDGPATWA